MDVTRLNSICLRIFLVLIIGIAVMMFIFEYANLTFGPLAVKLLPTASAEATLPDSYSTVETPVSGEHLLHTKIEYAGHTGEILTVFPVEPNSDRYIAGYRDGLERTSTRDAAATIPVTYVRVFPSLVVRDIPNASVWLHYRDTWRFRDIWGLLLCLLFILGAGYWFYRDVKKSRGFYSYRR